LFLLPFYVGDTVSFPVNTGYPTKKLKAGSGGLSVGYCIVSLQSASVHCFCHLFCPFQNVLTTGRHIMETLPASEE